MSEVFLAEKYNRNEFLSFLSQKFLPTDFEQSPSKIVIDKNKGIINNAFKLGSCPSLDLSIYEFNHNSRYDPRVTLSRESFNILKSDIEPNALAVFFNEDTSQWRFSLITSDYFPDMKKRHVKREFSNPRRFSYLLGEECKKFKHTPELMLITSGRVKNKDDLVSRFAIEVVTKKFYQELFKWYDSWAVDMVLFPIGKGANAALPKKPDANKNRQHLIRLITRLIFVWFLKQKDNLIPKEIFDEKEISKVLRNFDAHSEEEGNYYNGIIQNLFFATLNKPIQERIFANKNEADRKEDYSIKTKYRDFNNKSLFSDDYNPENNPNKIIKLFNPIPFLNGGLFECLDNFDTKEYEDGFSREQKRAAFVPNCLFWGDKEGKHEGLIPLLNRYNFTIEENTPQDIDIALDPELLGKVFENLLGTYNEETSSTARNESGSFYTPREIVDYMVDASLKEFLKEKLGSKENNIDEKLDKLFSYHEVDHDFDYKQVKILMNAISKCKILDPACGSGAFPMGILNKLAFVMQKLDPKNEILNEIKHTSNTTVAENNNYARKLFLIENCIYGVDIQPIAIQISKLRFFISLISDQKTGGNINNNYNILPLPNLETKFVASNTLIVDKRDNNFLDFSDEIEKKQNELLTIRQNHFSAHDAKEKIQLRKKDEELCKELSKLLQESGFFNKSSAKQLTEWNPYNQTKPYDFFDPYWMFGINNGFDIVIGNPPYIQLQSNHGKLADKYNIANYLCFSRSGDIYQLFYECGYNLLSENGHLCFITSNKWMRAAYGEKTRSFFAGKANPKILIDFAGQRVFDAVTVDVNILLVQKAKYQQSTHSCIIKEKCKNNMTDYIRQNGSSLTFSSNGQSWVILSDIEKSIKEKIEKIGKPLKEWDINIYRGILTGCNEAFIIDKTKRDELIAKDKKSVEIIRPILRGRDIKRYGYEFAEQYIIATFPSRRIEIENYPAVRDYLLKYGKKKLEQSGKPGARKKTPHKWYETQDTINYWDDFSKQKIIWGEISDKPKFALDFDGIYFPEATTFILTGENIEYLFTILNSTISEWFFSSLGTTTGVGTIRWKKFTIEQLLVIPPNQKVIKLINDLIINFKNNQISNIIFEKETNLIINHLYALDKQEVNYIEKQLKNSSKIRN